MPGPGRMGGGPRGGGFGGPRGGGFGGPRGGGFGGPRRGGFGGPRRFHPVGGCFGPGCFGCCAYVLGGAALLVGAVAAVLAIIL